MDRTCAWCGAAFEYSARRPEQKLCSRLCRGQYTARVNSDRRDAERARDRERDDSPWFWDGNTQHANLPPLFFDYRAYCMMCGDEQLYKLTRAQAALVRRIAPCKCGGRRWLEEDAGRATQPSTMLHKTFATPSRELREAGI